MIEDERTARIAARIKRALKRSVRGLEGTAEDNVAELKFRWLRILDHADRLGWVSCGDYLDPEIGRWMRAAGAAAARQREHELLKAFEM